MLRLSFKSVVRVWQPQKLARKMSRRISWLLLTANITSLCSLLKRLRRLPKSWSAKTLMSKLNRRSRSSQTSLLRCSYRRRCRERRPQPKKKIIKRSLRHRRHKHCSEHYSKRTRSSLISQFTNSSQLLNFRKVWWTCPESTKIKLTSRELWTRHHRAGPSPWPSPRWTAAQTSLSYRIRQIRRRCALAKTNWRLKSSLNSWRLWTKATTYRNSLKQ